MMFSVPQYIDVEDKIAGPLTGKQFLWMLFMAGILIVMWNTFDTAAFYTIAVPVVGLFCALAFYRPHGVSFITYIGFGLAYLIRPKAYVWQRTAEQEERRKASQRKYESQYYKPSARMTREDITAIAETLDTEGRRHPDRFMDILEREEEKKHTKHH